MFPGFGSVGQDYLRGHATTAVKALSNLAEAVLRISEELTAIRRIMEAEQRDRTRS